MQVHAGKLENNCQGALEKPVKKRENVYLYRLVSHYGSIKIKAGQKSPNINNNLNFFLALQAGKQPFTSEYTLLEEAVAFCSFESVYRG